MKVTVLSILIMHRSLSSTKHEWFINLSCRPLFWAAFKTRFPTSFFPQAHFLYQMLPPFHCILKCKLVFIQQICHWTLRCCQSCRLIHFENKHKHKVQQPKSYVFYFSLLVLLSTEVLPGLIAVFCFLSCIF